MDTGIARLMSSPVNTPNGGVTSPLIVRGAMANQSCGERLDLGTVLALLGTACGWSVDELARASGLSSRTVSDYEQGLIVPGLNTVQRVMGALGYPFSALDVARTCIGLLRSVRKFPPAVAGEENPA